jgi:simple sugar transport system substrate-binding protein
MGGWAALAATAALVGCSKTEPESTAAATSEAAPAATAPEPLNIAFAYVGPVGDAGWTYAHNEGRLAVEKEFGDKVKTSIVEKVPEGPEAERVIRDLVGQGAKLVFGTTFG